MLIRFLFLLTFCSASFSASAEMVVKDSKEFGNWKVQIAIDDFEGEVQPTLSSPILHVDGQIIGHFSVSHFMELRGSARGLVSFSMEGLSNAWPDCDFEFTKYKVDDGDARYYPTSGHACPTLVFNERVVDEFKAGNKFRFSVKNRTGIVDLKGFTKAWNYAVSHFRNH